MSPPAEIDLSLLPPEIRAAFEAERARRLALEAEVETLAEHNRRLEHLVKEFRQALYGKKSEKLGADERQLAFEDLEAAVAAAEEATDRSSATRSASRAGGVGVKRNQGRLPQELPRVELATPRYITAEEAAEMVHHRVRASTIRALMRQRKIVSWPWGKEKFTTVESMEAYMSWGAERNHPVSGSERTATNTSSSTGEDRSGRAALDRTLRALRKRSTGT